MLPLRQGTTIYRGGDGGDHLRRHIRPVCRQSVQSAELGKRRSDHAGMFPGGLGRPMFRRGGRIAQGLHGEALAIRGVVAGPRHDLWLVDHQPVHLVDDRAVDLARKSDVCRLRHRNGPRASVVGRGEREIRQTGAQTSPGSALRGIGLQRWHGLPLYLSFLLSDPLPPKYRQGEPALVLQYHLIRVYFRSRVRGHGGLHGTTCDQIGGPEGTDRPGEFSRLLFRAGALLRGKRVALGDG